MVKNINIALKEKSLKAFEMIKNNALNGANEIRITNVHLKQINKTSIYKPFKKNDLFVDSSTLYDAMQPVGGTGRHHYHGLKIEEIYDAILSFKKAKGLLPSYGNRYVILTTVIASCGYKIIAIIDTCAPLMNDRNANINKLITLYPKEMDEKLFK